MLKINENGTVYGRDIYSAIESKTADFSIWVNRAIENADLQIGKDFSTFLKESTGGRPSKEYAFTLQAAKEICLLERNEKGKQIRRWLIELEEQKQNFDLLTHDQVVYLTVLKEFFKYVENQKDIAAKHIISAVGNSAEPKQYAEFHIWRNKMLNIETETVDKMVKEFCIEHQKRMPKLATKAEKILFLDSHLALRNAVWDFLSIKGEINSLKLADLVKRMADAENLQLFQKNETDLFRPKENIDRKQLGL